VNCCLEPIGVARGNRLEVDHRARPARKAGFDTELLCVPSDQPPRREERRRVALFAARIEPPTTSGPGLRLVAATKSRLRALRGVTGPSAVRFDAFGYVVERIHEREVAYCLPLPRMAYGRLGRSQVGCDRQYAVRLRCFSPTPWGGQLEDAPRDLKPPWRGGDRSPLETKSNYAGKWILSSPSNSR